MPNPIESLKSQIDQEALWQGEKRLRRGDFLVQSGEIERHLYFVRAGALRVFVHSGEEERVMRFGYEGSFINALDSFISGQPTVCCVQALRACELQYIGKAAFLDFVRADAERLRLWSDLMMNLVHQQIERELDLLTDSPAERYRRVFERSPQLFQLVPACHIASYLRMRPETLSRLKKQP